MYIVLSNTTTETAVIRNATELAGYINTTPSRILRNTKSKKRWEFENYTIIVADYVQIKSNSGGVRTKKDSDKVDNSQNKWE